MFADLHLHSRFSDGTFTPEELVAHARRHGLSALALTDHDSVEGCEPMRTACAVHGLEFVPGTELTAEHNGAEVHILGYFIDVTHPRLLAELARFQRARQNRIREMCARLQALNVPLQAETVFALAQCNSPGRPHVARSLVERGHCSTLDEAFERFLKRDRPAWVPKTRISAREAIALIHQAGGLAVLAHPVLNHADHLIPVLAAEGLDGLECFHTKHSEEATQRYLAMATQHGLLITGGSDCHGDSKGRPLIGSIKLPYAYVEALQTARRRRARRRSNAPARPAPA
ncbi:MAG: PHP domain-containing protein [Verrucomicrobiales bacterium]|nr:PHP domain-containing protein [Verrucomicrobiales bacterium]